MKKIYVGKSKISGKGIFAGEDVKKGEIIQYIKGKPIRKVIKSQQDSKRTANWIGAGRNIWMKTNGTPFRYINHSCNPNAALTGKKTLIAMENIRAGEEICFDYSMTDVDSYYHITCNCGEKNCRIEIRAIYSVPIEVFKKHMPYVSKYFQRVFIRNHVLTESKRV